MFGMSNLYRSSDEKVIAGVCAGLAHRLDLNMTGLRWVVALVSLFLSGIPAIVYIALWAVLKSRPSEWVVQHVLRKTFAELLADAPGTPDWVKFIRERMDLKRYRPAA